MGRRLLADFAGTLFQECTHALPRIADMSQSGGLFVEALMSSIAQGDEAAKERVRAFLEKRAGKVGK